MTGALDSWNRWTTAATSASSRSSGTARVTSPSRSASAAVRLAPVSRISKARLRPTSRGRSAAATVLKTPPRISGCPSFALCAAQHDVARGREDAAGAEGGPRHDRERGLVDLGERLEDAPEALEHHVARGRRGGRPARSPPRSTCPPPNRVTTFTSLWYSSDSIAVAELLHHLDARARWPGGRFSVMRVMPCAVSTWMCLKLSDAHGREHVVVVRVARSPRPCAVPFLGAPRPSLGGKPRACRSLSRSGECSTLRAARPQRTRTRRCPARRRRAARRRGRGGPRSPAGRSSPTSAQAAPGATSEYVRTSGSVAPAELTSSPSRPRPPSASRSASSRFVVRLPKRSTWRTVPSPARRRVRVFGGSARRTGSATAGRPPRAAGRARGGRRPARRGRGRGRPARAARGRASGFASRWTRAAGWASSTRVKQAVVRAHEQPAAGADRERPPLRADARVDDRHEDGARREVPVRGVEGERARRDVVGRDLVDDVDERRLRAGGQDRALHRPDVVVARGRSP